jgi:hypothetical protein
VTCIIPCQLCCSSIQRATAPVSCCCRRCCPSKHPDPSCPPHLGVGCTSPAPHSACRHEGLAEAQQPTCRRAGSVEGRRREGGGRRQQQGFQVRGRQPVPAAQVLLPSCCDGPAGQLLQHSTHTFLPNRASRIRSSMCGRVRCCCPLAGWCCRRCCCC